jgi:predicted nuclease of predicted toxin-antitoxin system
MKIHSPYILKYDLYHTGLELLLEPGGTSMKILLDEMYTGMKEYLEALGWEIYTVVTLSLQGADDSKIIEYAKENEFVIVTQDEKLADIAELRRVECVLISKKMVAKMIDLELRKKYQEVTFS